MEHKKKDFSLSWFFRWFLDNKAITGFLVTLLLGLNIFVLSKISFIFLPILEFIGVIMLPVILAGLLYYLLNPIVDFMEKHRINRLVAITIVFILIALLLIWGLAVAIPSLQHQIVSFAKNLPANLKKSNKIIQDFLENRISDDVKPQLEEIANNFSNQVTTWASHFSSKAVNWVSTLISTASQVIVAIIIMPFILFYLLRDGKNLKSYLTKFMPTKFRDPVGQILTDVNTQLANYVRGQVTVAIIVAIMFIIFFKIIDLRYAVTLGVTAGPIMLLKVIVVFIVEQTIEGRFVSPLILGSQLNIHPINVLFVLLTAGSMFGIWGVLLGIPIYASAKVVITAIFKWYKKVSGLYEEELVDETGERIEQQ